MFLCSLICVGILGIDFGSQYAKMAESTISGEPRVIKDAANSAAVPSAAATKYPIDLDAIPEKLTNFPIFFGTKAVRHLKRHPDHGYEFLPMTIGRSNTSFHTSANITTPEFVSLYFMDYLLSHGNTHGLTFAIPSYWTPLQRDALLNSLKMYKMPVEAVIDDVEALAAHYGAIRYTRYQKATRNVLFVDMGATSFKVYGVTFQWNRKGQFSMANETANEWSEKVGGYYCARVVAAKEGISIRKAEKRIKIDSSRYYHLFRNQTNIMETLLKRAVSRIQHQTKFNKFKKNSFKIDEIQLIGGASKMPFVKQLVINVTNCTNVLRDFNINEEISVGAVYCVQNHRGLSKTPPVFFQKSTPLTFSVKCNGYRTVCNRGNKCKNSVTFNHQGCDVVEVVAPEEEVPEGASRVLASYTLLNMTDMKYEEGDKPIGIVTMDKNHEPKIEGVTWCKGQDCYPIAAQYDELGNVEMKHGVKFLTAYSLADQERRKRDKVIAEIEEYMAYFNMENFDQFPPNIRWDLEPIKASYEMGTMRTMEVEELKEYAETLKNIIISTMPEVQLPPPQEEKVAEKQEESAPEDETKAEPNIHTEL